MICSQQHGFTRCKSTATNLLSFINDVSQSVDVRVQVDAIYTDFSSAFDKVDHNILIRKLQLCGIHDPMLSWFRSYLTDRVQRVIVGGFTSSPYEASSGVPQGSHLGPILFLVFVNDIVDCLHHSKALLFADDLKIYKPVRSANDATLLQVDLDAIFEWCRNNNMILNASKCYHIKITRNKNVIQSNYSINGVRLEQVNCFRDLGVLVDSKLSFIQHIDSVVGKAAKMVGFIKRNCKDFKKPSSLLCLFNTLARSHLEYASSVWNPSYKNHINRIERVQRRFTRFIAHKDINMPKNLDYCQRLSSLKVDPLHKRRTITDLINLYKLFNGLLCSPELLSEISIVVPRQNFRLKTRKIFKPRQSRTNLGYNSPFNRIINSYNTLYKNHPSLDVFVARLSCFKEEAHRATSQA